MAKDKDDDLDEDETEENVPSELDELTHAELRIMYEKSYAALLFAKNIQWRSVGASLITFAACIAIAVSTDADRSFANLLSALTILLATGVIFVLVMYQFWQYNEISRINEIERHFSSLYRDIRDIKSRREGMVHRYTLLTFMITTVILGAIVANLGIKQAL